MKKIALTITSILTAFILFSGCSKKTAEASIEVIESPFKYEENQIVNLTETGDIDWMTFTVNAAPTPIVTHSQKTESTVIGRPSGEFGIKKKSLSGLPGVDANYFDGERPKKNEATFSAGFGGYFEEVAGSKISIPLILNKSCKRIYLFVTNKSISLNVDLIHDGKSLASAPVPAEENIQKTWIVIIDCIAPNDTNLVVNLSFEDSNSKRALANMAIGAIAVSGNQSEGISSIVIGPSIIKN